MTTSAEPFSPESLAELPPAGPADEAVAAETGCALDEDVETEVPAYVAPSEAVPPPRTTVAIGPLRVRPAVLAWVVSIAVHAALAAASLLVISWQASHASLIEGPGWGDGAAETGMIDTPGPAGGGPNVLDQALPGGPALAAGPRPSLSGDPTDESTEPAVSDATPEILPAEMDDEPPVPQPTVSASSLEGLASLTVTHSPPPALARPPAGGSADQAGATAGGNTTGTAPSIAAGTTSGAGPAGAIGPGRGATGDGGTAYSGRPGSPGGVRGRRGLARPVYPVESRRRGEQGRVLLDIEVLPDGAVGDVRVAADPGYPRLVAAAVAQVRREHFTPLIEGGSAVPYRLTVPYDFRLQ